MIDQLNKIVPEKYQPYILLAAVLLPWLGRCITAARNGGGLIEMVRSVFYGSTTVHNPEPTGTNITTPTVPPGQGTPSGGTTTRFLPMIVLACGLFGVMAAAMLTTSCTTSQTTTAYKTETAIDASVVTAWNLWTNYASAANVPTNTRIQVAVVFNKVKAAELVAIDATAIAAASTNQTLLATMTSSVAAESAALTDLRNLLATFNIKF